LQVFDVPGTQLPAPSQASPLVQAFASVQVVPGALGR